MRLSAIKKRLGDLLVDVGIITAVQLKQALDMQKHTGGKLGTILAQMGLINEEVMLAFLGKQCGVSYISLAEYGEIPSEVIRIIPESIVRHQNLVPISRDGKVVTVAMADPFNVFAIDDIKMITGYDVQVVIASEAEIKEAIEKYYSLQSNVDDNLQDLPDNLKKLTGEKEAVMLEKAILSPMLSVAANAGAAKVFFEPQENHMRVRYRIDGYLKEQSRLSKELAAKIILYFHKAGKIDEDKSGFGEFETKIEINDRKTRVLVSLLETHYGASISIEILGEPAEPLELGKLGFEAETLSIFKKNIETPSGLILITGPASSGKTLTMHSAMKALNYPDKKILSFENRTEYSVAGVIQVSAEWLNDPEGAALSRIVGTHEPDIVFIENLLDGEKYPFALNSALSGRTVIATMAASDCFDALNKLLRSGIEPSLLASTLVMISNQKLMRVICQSCKETYELPAGALKSLGYEPGGEAAQNELKLKRATGCPECNNTGYSGRTAIFEIYETDDTMRSLISERAPDSSFREHYAQKKFVTLQEAAFRKILSGASSVEEFLRLTKN